jgi:peptidoglycan/xylan/chitin deacetylase (PgdA/CDA1 family)
MRVRRMPGRAHGLAALAIAVAAAGFLSVRSTPAPIELAITVDDLTRPHLEGVVESPEHVIDHLLDAFARNRLPPVTGFLNGATSDGRAEERAALARWIAAGNLLGNHTYSHLDLARVDVPTFLADIDRNEDELLRVAGPPLPGRDWRVFRFPFLQEGATLAARETVRAHLRERGYRIAQVTVDFEDWQWFPAWARCARGGSEPTLEVLRALYRESARKELLAADALARELFGRPIRHILLLHAGAFTAGMIDDLVEQYEALGVRFIPLDDALADPVYQLDPSVARSWGSPFLAQVEASRGVPARAAPWPPHGELAALCR